MSAEIIRGAEETTRKRIKLHARILKETGLEMCFNVKKCRWSLRRPETCVEDHDPIYLGDCYLTKESEIEWLLARAEETGNPFIIQLITRQIEDMRNEWR